MVYEAAAQTSTDVSGQAPSGTAPPASAAAKGTMMMFDYLLLLGEMKKEDREKIVLAYPDRERMEAALVGLPHAWIAIKPPDGSWWQWMLRENRDLHNVVLTAALMARRYFENWTFRLELDEFDKPVSVWLRLERPEDVPYAEGRRLLREFDEEWFQTDLIRYVPYFGVTML